jgi:eukaryotic-like serine/threonine-protein kinase
MTRRSSERVREGSREPSSDHGGAPSEPRSWALEEGEEIVPGRFALEELGGGDQYQAYLAWDERLASLVVAKLVRPHLVEDELVLKRLAREARLLRRLAHPVVVRGFDAVLDGRRPHVVMEHLEGPTLSSTIRRFGALSVDQLIPLAFQLASALWYLRNVEVVHLDVKPGNIILGVPPRLVDLSVARSFTRAREITSPIGTDAYMAPEQCDPALGVISSPADVWGLGATLHHAISGDVPFERGDEVDDDDSAARFPQLHDFPRLLPASCPTELETLVLDTLEPDPHARPAPADISAALEPLLGRLRYDKILGRSRPRIL